MSEGYLRPKVATPELIRSRNNGMFVNPPPYMDNWGGFTNSSKLHKTKASSQMSLERGGPQARGSKPF